MIVCLRCKNEKIENCFCKNKKHPNGLNKICKICDVKLKTDMSKRKNLVPSYNKCSICLTDYAVHFYTKKRNRNTSLCPRCRQAVGQETISKKRPDGAGWKWKNNTKVEKKLYASWQGIKSRCYSERGNRKNSSYIRKGITVCDEWVNDFDTFVDWSKKNGYREDFHLDRINPNESYNPKNCRYIKSKENSKRVQAVILDDIHLIIKYYNQGFNNIEIYNKLYDSKSPLPYKKF